ncbi:layilin isoform X2 [Brachyhypopomus gauderio]|uniref:layilin isoform X2 n=1 Tax=Brachyhypopomus gauderio TaxID=698409 RepID=UPI0040438204
MDLMRVIGAVLAVCYQPSCALKGFTSERICRRGTEKPCYKVVYQQTSGLRVNFDVASRACRDDSGELLSIETENEQRLVEKFVRGLRAPDGDFWIGLRRSSGPQSGDCSSRYYWLDHSQATYRNWFLNEPSCGSGFCATLYHRSPSLVTPQPHYMFKWTDSNCNAKNNFICKYSAEKSPVATPAGNFTTHSVSFSDDSVSVYYVVMVGVPVLLLATVMASGFFCYRVLSRKRKEPNHIYAEPGPWMSAAAVRNRGLEYMSSEINGNVCATSSGCHGDYENVPSVAAGFVTNDIYETCRSPAATEAGWVDNDIYGY